MIVIEKNEGEKIDYSVEENKLNLNDEMTLDLSRYERDFDVHIDICKNQFDFLTFGISERYVAQIDIPAKEYQEIDDGTDEEGNPKTKLLPVPFSIEKVSLTLWSVEG